LEPLSEAQKKFASDNIALFYDIVPRMKSLVEAIGDLDDATDEAILTYINCVKKYKPELGWKFSAFLNNAIWKALLNTAKSRFRERSRLGTRYHLQAAWRNTECPAETADSVAWLRHNLHRAGNADVQLALAFRYGLITGSAVQTQQIASFLKKSPTWVSKLLSIGIYRLQVAAGVPAEEPASLAKAWEKRKAGVSAKLRTLPPGIPRAPTQFTDLPIGKPET
jgi:hypothetical protein